MPTPPAPPADNPKATAAMAVSWCIASYWRRREIDRPERLSIRCRVLAPSGKSIFQAEQEVDLDRFLNFRTLIALPLLPLHGAGVYQFVMYAGDGKTWKRVGAMPVTLKFIAPPAAEQPQVTSKAGIRKRKAH